MWGLSTRRCAELLCMKTWLTSGFSYCYPSNESLVNCEDRVSVPYWKHNADNGYNGAITAPLESSRQESDRLFPEETTTIAESVNAPNYFWAQYHFSPAGGVVISLMWVQGLTYLHHCCQWGSWHLSRLKVFKHTFVFVLIVFFPHLRWNLNHII